MAEADTQTNMIPVGGAQSSESGSNVSLDGKGNVITPEMQKALDKNDMGKNVLLEYDHKWRNRTMNQIKLGEYLDESTELREYFYKIFNDKGISKQEREKLIAEI